jgi:ATP/ADP translocase
MILSAETCARWKKRKFVRQPHRMVIGMIVCLFVSIYTFTTNELEAAKLFGIVGLVFLFFYTLANYIVWKAREIEPDC